MAVVYGAAIKAAILCGELDSDVPDIYETVPHSLGIETVGEKMSNLINKDSPLPSEVTKM